MGIMKIWIYPYSIKGENETIYLETSDPRLLGEKLLDIVKNIDKYHKIKIEILNGEAKQRKKE